MKNIFKNILFYIFVLVLIGVYLMKSIMDYGIDISIYIVIIFIGLLVLIYIHELKEKVKDRDKILSHYVSAKKKQKRRKTSRFKKKIRRK